MHPTIKLINVLILIVATNIVSESALFVFTLILLILLLQFRVYHLVKVLSRLKWLLLSIALVYAFTTPGEYLQQWSSSYAPTYEGLHQGGMQLLRIFLIVSGLTLFTATTDRQQIMTGFYIFLRPLNLLGFSVERFTARLWLTLHYVEHKPQETLRLSIFQRLKSTSHLQVMTTCMAEPIELHLTSVKAPEFFVPCVLVLSVFLVDFWLK